MFELKEKNEKTKAIEITRAKLLEKTFEDTISAFKEHGLDLELVDEIFNELNSIELKIHEIEEKISELNEQLRKYRQDYEAKSREIESQKRYIRDLASMFDRVFYGLLDELGDVELKKYAPKLYDFMNKYAYLSGIATDTFIEISPQLAKGKVALYVYMLNNFIKLRGLSPVVVNISGRKISVGRNIMTMSEAASMFNIRQQTVSRELSNYLVSKNLVKKVENVWVLWNYETHTVESYAKELNKLLKLNIKLEVS